MGTMHTKMEDGALDRSLQKRKTYKVEIKNKNEKFTSINTNNF